MNESIWQVGGFATLVAVLWGGGIYGEKSTKPLWLAWVIPSLTLTVFLFAIIFIKIPLRELNVFFLIAGGYYIFIPIALGGLSYWMASRTRGSKNNRHLSPHSGLSPNDELIALTFIPGGFWIALLNNIKSPNPESLMRCNPYYFILLMLAIFLANVWERYFK